MSMKKPPFVGVRLLFLGPCYVILKSLIRNQSTYISKVNVNLCCNGNIQNQLTPLRHNVFAGIHTSNILSFSNKPEMVKKAEKKVAPKKKKKSLGQRIMHELKHYYQGFRLLFMNAKIGMKLTIKRLGGHQLTRREHKLLKRTAGDIFRLLPFSIFIIVPFMELTLPIFLKLFPGMLPTTFQTNKEKVEKAKKSFKAKLEMTKFLQETLDGMAPLTISSESSELAKDFTDFFQKIRTTGQIPSTQDILKYSRLFEDEITLDKLPRAQIIALCRYLNITAIGTTRFLRFQLKSKIRSIQIDDKIIQKEGLRTMKPGELKEACKVRGMRFYGISNERLKEQLQQWLELSVVKKIPPSLLLLSQAFALTNKLPNERALAATIQTLPSEVGTAHTVALSEREGQLDYETEIRMLKDELLKIAEENIETQSDLNRKMESFMLDAEKDTSEELSRYQALEEKMNEDISVNELATLEDALALNLYIEKDCLSELKTDLEQYQQRITELEDVMAKLKQSEMIIETIAAKRLHRKLLIIIKGLDDALEAIEHRETDTEERTRLNLRIKTPGTVKIDELMDMLRDKRLGDPLPLKAESQIAFILNKLDSDNDGFIKIRKLTKLLERLSSEESKVDLVSVTEYIKEIHNEEKLDNINKSENDNRRPS